jgi:hypothetical protein
MQTAVSRVLIGPYGFHAFLGVVLALFLGFLWVFNFTTFFEQPRTAYRTGQVGPDQVSCGSQKSVLTTS